jgi:nicotinamide mononucleotide transporter
VITAYLLYLAGYLGDMMINAYFSIMSIYGWYRWAKGKQSDDLPFRGPVPRKGDRRPIVRVTILVVYGIYKFFDQPIHKDNYIDIFASGLFFTGMWYMALKKIENWTLWIIGDIIVVPLYAYRGLGMLSLQYLIFTILAVSAYLAWKKTLNSNQQTS